MKKVIRQKYYFNVLRNIHIKINDSVYLLISVVAITAAIKSHYLFSINICKKIQWSLYLICAILNPTNFITRITIDNYNYQLSLLTQLLFMMPFVRREHNICVFNRNIAHFPQRNVAVALGSFQPLQRYLCYSKSLYARRVTSYR